MGRAARPRKEPDSTAPAPRSGEELKQSQSPRADWRTWRGGCRGGAGFGRQVRAPRDGEKRPRPNGLRGRARPRTANIHGASSNKGIN
ncbi:hypothetical protein NDU88_003709 [Pleurodeles waltl]|uniref:Uncharacterized protein n=1 Tax=Pleurodeles waltl TaxID=8319 RepID=A0AAV7TRX0_PLEWA|nr:hypothetical protein NDU88_003709 [Pleurodeles waltl]